MTSGPHPRSRSQPVHRASRRRRFAAAGAPATCLALLVVGTGAAALTSSSVASAAPPSTVVPPAAAATAVQPLTGTNSAWRKSVRSAPVNASSKSMVGNLVSQVAKGPAGVAALNVWQYNAPIVHVDRRTRRVNVRWNDCQHKGGVPRGLTGAGGVFTSVPIPWDAKPAPGNDKHFTIWEEDTDQAWDFWKLQKTPSGWQACWGGRIDHLSTNRGYFPNGFGASASGTLIAAGAIRISEVRAGRIDHAIALNLRSYGSWKQFSYPAQRSDGYSGGGPIIMGTRFRLPATIDVTRLGLSPIGVMVARAAQQYGFIVTDKGGVVSIAAQSGAMIAAQNGGVEPWVALLGRSKSYNVLAGFPWSRLQALQKDYGKP